MGRPSRPSRCLGPIILRASSMSFQRRSIRRVSIAPGEIVLARMPCAAWSAASTFASWIKAPLVAQYAGRPGEATRPSCEAMRITRPPPRVVIAGIAAFAIRKAPVRLIRITRSQAASSISSTVAALSLSAAPYIRTSRPPKRCTVAATAPRQLAPSVTSRCTGSAWPPPASISAAVVFAPGSSMSAHATLAPAAAKASAVARPIPFAAPTTMAIFFSSVNAGSIIESSICSRASVGGTPAPRRPAVRTWARATVYDSAHLSRREVERDATDARALRLLEHHQETRLCLARRPPPGRLRGAQHRGVQLRRRQGGRDRAAGPGPEPQRLQLARLRQSRGHLATVRAARRPRYSRRGTDEHRGLRDGAGHPREVARARRRDPRTRGDELGRAGASGRGPGTRADRKRDGHDRAARGGPAGGLDEPVAVEQRRHDGSPAGGGLPLRDGLDDGRPAHLDPHAQGPDPRDAVPDRGERHARDRLVPLHRGRVRRPDRRPVRRDARAVGAPAARVPDLAPSVRHGTALPDPPSSPRAPAHSRAPGPRVADAPARDLRARRIAAAGCRARKPLTSSPVAAQPVGRWKWGRPVCAVRPPSATMAAPVMNDASSEARKSTVLAISSASPTRPIGCAAAYIRLSSSARSRPRIWVARVSMKPGQTQLMRMLCRAVSIAPERVGLIAPALAAL